MSRQSKRIPLMISIKHAKYLMELIEDDLELDDENVHTILSEEDRLMAESILNRLKDIEPAVDKWKRQQKRLEAG